MTNITLVAAVDYALAIGRTGINSLPWHLRADMDHFKDLTKGGTVALGRNTFESLPNGFRPLPGRNNWVLTQDPHYHPEHGCWIARGVMPVLIRSEEEEIFAIGGAQIYRLFYEYATRMVLTHVQTTLPEADAFFPELPKEWVQTKLYEHGPDKKNDFRFTIVDYRKPQFTEKAGRP